MDIYDYLFKAKNQFYLGHYQRVLELWRDADRSVEPESAEFSGQETQYVELLVFAHKSILHFVKSDEEKLKENQALLDKHARSLELYLTYFAKADEGLGEDSLEETLRELGEIDAEAEEPWLATLLALSKKVIHNYLCFAQGKFDLFVSIEPKFAEAATDFLMLKFQAFARNQQFKEARRIFEAMKAENDEHILVNFCEYEIANRFERNHEAALEILAEVKQKFGESPKLINMNAASLMLKTEFFKVR